jgi:4-hydroxy-3-methylbut-2-enyl diphosphate reductase IspH
MITYTYSEIIHNNEVVGILRNEDKAAIPLDPGNSDYKAYLASIAEDTNGNI